MREVSITQYKGNAVLNLPQGSDGKTFGFGVGKARLILEHIGQLRVANADRSSYTIRIEGKYPKMWRLTPEQVSAIVECVNDIELFVERSDGGTRH